PHNVYLCTKYDAHINVEICTSIHSIKYVYKYVYKGHDRASARVVQQGANSDDDQTSDEISTFLDARYVSALEGCWRLFSFSLNHEYPAHRRLAIHLQDEQLVYFNEGETATDVIQGRAHETTLTAWFEYNRQYPNDTAFQNTLYINFPEDYVFVDHTRSWKIRERGHGGTIGRIYAVSPREVEMYHLRVLLYHVPGGKSFADMRTIDRGTQNAEILPTFQAAAQRCGLITGQQEWNDCHNQANTYQQPYVLRRLFAVILVFCHPDNPYNLWLSHRDSMTEDYLHIARQEQNDQNIQFSNFLYNQALLDTKSVMINLSQSLRDFDGFVLQEVVNEHNAADNNEPAIIREHCRLAAQLALQPEQQFQFNEDQQPIFNAIINYLDAPQDQPKLCFVDGPGGTGKTYLFNAILEHIRWAGHIALAVTTSGTAALLLYGGRTAHSTYKIPLEVHQTSMCNFAPGSATARLISMASIIVWDEASMISRDLIETVNRSVQDIMHVIDPALEHIPFGGKVVVLPVIPNAERPRIVPQCLNQSRDIWRHVVIHRLRTNMPVQQAANTANANQLRDFAEYLLRIGNGAEPIVPNTEDRVQIPTQMLMPRYNTYDLIAAVFGNLHLPTVNRQFLTSRAILTPKNKDVAILNNLILDQFRGDISELKSADIAKYLFAPGFKSWGFALPPFKIADFIKNTVDDLEYQIRYLNEFLNSLDPSDLPPHNLKLKVGCRIMLLRNLDTANGLSEIATGRQAGTIVLIPRITLTPSQTQSPIIFKRTQFPIQLAFSMTINKAQGQTFDNVGLYLPEPPFTHGLLYVAMSRVRTPASIRIMLNPDNSTEPDQEGFTTRNVVYHEVLL
ncbi:hypothetical protein INT45_003163, partial [Circinella minor]